MHGVYGNGVDVGIGRAAEMIVTDRAEKFVPAGHRLFAVSSLVQRPEIRTPATRLRLDDSFVDGNSINEFDDVLPGISRFRLNKDSEGEELTVSGKNAAVVSYPLGALKRTYSTTFFIKDAFWHKFESGAPSGCPETSKTCEPFEAICLIGDDEIDFYSTINDEKLSMRLPFEITGAHRTKYGLLLQRKMYPEDHELAKRNADLPLPLLFTLSHPLNEILPIVMKPLDGEISARYACESAVSVVAVIDDLSLVLTYNSLTQLHSLWFAKKATYEEALSAAQRAEQSTCSLASVGTPGSAFRS
uniref:Anaphase-promoting complex subunit 1 n=1 Tax=Plectus sambesii TaxID=2011161 RepID=A0A914W6J5_9BILA